MNIPNYQFEYGDYQSDYGVILMVVIFEEFGAKWGGCVRPAPPPSGSAPGIVSLYIFNSVYIGLSACGVQR